MNFSNYPCNMGDPSNWQSRGYHRFAANRHGIIVCEFCGEHPPARTMHPRKQYGLDHPTWFGPNCFAYDSVEDAEAAIAKVYGDESGHIVVELVTISTSGFANPYREETDR